MKAIVNANIVLETGIIWDATVLTDGDEISAFGKEIEIPENAEIIDAEGCYVGPGLVDIHVHGINGFHTALNPVEAAEIFLRHGETTILATPSYDMDKKMQIECIKTYKENPAQKLYKRLGFEVYKKDDTHIYLDIDFKY